MQFCLTCYEEKNVYMDCITSSWLCGGFHRSQDITPGPHAHVDWGEGSLIISTHVITIS